MKKVFIKIGLCLVSLFILLPTNVKALNEYEVVDNSYTYILRQAESAGDGQNTETDGDLCDEDLQDFVTKYWGVVVAISPALLILMVSIDFFKAITSGDADKIKKSSSDALKRTLAFILLLFLPFIVRQIFSWIGLKFCLGSVKFN